MSQPKLILRPPPHREFIQGFPGIAGAGNRPPAHVAGTIEVRLGTKGLKAAWLRIELRKLETLPGGESWGELIGKGPIDVWTARKDEAHKADAEKGWELLQTADFPFQVFIPEGLPPSAKLDKQAGITYELVSSLCVRTKKGLLRKETTSSVIQNTHPVWLDKHELHSMWPIYFTPDDHEAVQDDIRVKVLRSQSCFGLGDSVDVKIIVSSNRVSPIKLKTIACVVRETVTYKGSAKKSFSSSSKGASQKTENLSAKSKNYGKKIYKGDSHTFDLACQIPRNHSLMTIETAKHIEVSYALRIIVETGKKPIVIDHLPITVSNFTKAASDAMVQRIGYVDGLSGPALDTIDNGSIAYPPVEGSPSVSRSMSYSASTIAGARSAYPGYVGGDLRRRDTVMTQGTAISGSGMAGRGVPGQVFSWGQYGSAQPFGASTPPRSAFAGPSSIYEGYETPQDDNRAQFHSTSRPPSAMGLASGMSSVLAPSSSYLGHSGGVTPIRERSEDGHYSEYSHMSYPNLGNGASPRLDGQRSVSNPSYRQSLQGLPQQQQFGNQSLPSSRVIPSQQHQQHLSALAAAEAALGFADGRSAEAEKERLYERARQQAERNQRRADERRAHNQSVSQASIITPVAANGGRPFSMINPPATGPSSSSSHAIVAPTAQQGLSAEAEKARLYERARLEAEEYQSSFNHGAAFPANAGVGASSSQQSGLGVSPNRSSSAYWTEANTAATQPVQTAAASKIASGKPTPYSSYMTTEEEKRVLYERAKAEAEDYQRSDQTPKQSATAVLAEEWPKTSANTGSAGATASGSSRAAPAATSSLTTASTMSEKEQLKRYYEARDAVAQNVGSGSVAHANHSNGHQYEDDPMYTPEVASAVHHATPRQPADTVATPSRLTPSGMRSESPFASYVDGEADERQGLRLNTAVHSYLTESEQQSAIEKERLASHFARKAANADARAAAKSTTPAPASASATAPKPVKPAAEYAYSHSRDTSAVDAVNGSQRPAKTELPPAASGGNAASEKAQLAAYYAARDAVDQNLGNQGGSSANATASSAAAPIREVHTASPMVFGNMGSKAYTGDDTGSIYTDYNPQNHVQQQWRPRYASLYDENDGDLDGDLDGIDDANDQRRSASTAPPPLPPKIPLNADASRISTVQGR